MYENGTGIVAIGRVKALWDHVQHREPRYYTNRELQDLTGGAFEYRIDVDWFIDLTDKPITIDQMRLLTGYGGAPRGAVRKIVARKDDFERLVSELANEMLVHPEEISGSIAFVEGAARQVVINRYERNPKARSTCIEHHGARCKVCGIDLSCWYGPLAEGLIHVHHIVPLNEIGEEYEVNPIEDLVPVCPNGHTVIHLGGACRSIEDVQALLRQHACATNSDNPPICSE